MLKNIIKTILKKIQMDIVLIIPQALPLTKLKHQPLIIHFFYQVSMFL